MANSDNERYATTDEVLAKLKSLSNKEILFIATSARIFTWNFPKLELFSEAIQRFLGGNRRWPREVDFTMCIQQAMRSIAHEWHQKNLGDPAAVRGPEGEMGTGAAEQPDSRLMIKEMKARVEAQFADDEIVLAVVKGHDQGLSPQEIQNEVAITPNDYRAAQKRIRRAVLAGKLSDLR